MQKLSIIIPVFNEKDTIHKILEKIEIIDFGKNTEIIIVDDFSTDGTRDILKSIESRYKVLYHDRNFGKGMAIRTGLKEVTGDWVVVQDADLEYDPNDLKILLDKMLEENLKVIYGSRRLGRSYFSQEHSGHLFTLGGLSLTWLTNILYGTDITDEPTCYKMFETDFLKDLKLECVRFEFCPEVTAKTAKRGIEIKELPIRYYPRHKNEGKKIKLKDFFEAVWTLLKYRFKK